MIRLLRDCAVAAIAYVHVGAEILCPTLAQHMAGRGYDKHDEERR